MKYNSKVFFLILAFFMLSFAGCSGTTANSIKKVHFPIKSFVKFESKLYRLKCTPRDPEDMNSACREQIDGATGSGSVVGESVDGVYILTAGHMCDRKGDLLNFNNMLGREIEEPIEEKYYVHDIDLFQYNVKVLEFDKEDDVCLAFAWGLFAPSLKLSKKGPEIGEKVYNMAAPAGYMSARAVPLFEGRYFGQGKDMDLYTVPAVGGSSGSPIFNKDSEVVGMIYARHSHFHEITISPRHKRLIQFVMEGIKKDVAIRNKSHSVPRLKGLKIKISD